MEIIKKTKDVEEAIFYIRRTIENGWSCSALKNSMDADVYHKHSGAVSNFADKLSLPQAALAQEITKENYDFGFLTLPDGFSEAQLEAALTIQMTRALPLLVVRKRLWWLAGHVASTYSFITSICVAMWWLS